jgi:hypothetical protein
MKRRDFISGTTMASVALAARPIRAVERSFEAQAQKNAGKWLNAYYFCAHTYTLVPRHVREDLQWMADAGTDAVSLSILEQDLFAAVENVEIVCNEAARLGIEVYAVPSRWGGLFAGAPKVPSLFSSTHPESLHRVKGGEPFFSSFSGVRSSIYYPEVLEFFCESLDKVLDLWDIRGIILDEPKSYSLDYSEKALEVLGPYPSREAHLASVVAFHEKICRHIKENHPRVRTCLFSQANASDLAVKLSARMDHLDDFGADGRPWGPEDGGQAESEGKTLLGPGERHLAAARGGGKRALWLIENHNMRTADIRLMERRMPEILEKGVGHLIYYYYPRNLEDPDVNMRAVARSISGYK